MNFRNVAVVYRKELTEWLRDRRTLISTVLVPLLAFPILMVGMTSLMTVMIGKAEKETAKVMIIGGEDSPQVVEKLRQVKDVEIVPYEEDWKKRISEKEIRAAVDIPCSSPKKSRYSLARIRRYSPGNSVRCPMTRRT